MKTIGLLGGMSWESTHEYYRLINQYTNKLLGDLHSAELLLYSVDFEPIKELQHQGRWDELASIMIKRAQQLEAGGAECLVICTNTMHRMAEEVQTAIGIPLIHIADTTAQKVRERKDKTVGLLATGFTMEQDFYRGRLEEKHGIGVIVPEKKDRDIVHRIIYDELCKGQIFQSSKEQYLEIIQKLVQQEVQSIILGCTEIMLLIMQEDVSIPLLDSTAIHAEEAVRWSLG